MASHTPNLDLLKKNPATDGNDTFNIETMLNENWEKIDAAVGQVKEEIADIEIPLSDATNGTRSNVAASEKAVGVVGAQLAEKAPLASPVFTGSPKIGQNDVIHVGNISQYAPTPNLNQLDTFGLAVIVNQANGDDSVGGGPYRTLTAAVKYINSLKFRAGFITLYINPGTYNESVTIENFSGGGLRIMGSGSCIVNSLTINETSAIVKISNISFGNFGALENENIFRGIYLSSCPSVWIYSCQFRGRTTSFVGVEADASSKFHIESSTFTNCITAVSTSRGCVGTLRRNSGSGNLTGYRSGMVSLLIIDGDSTMTATSLKSKEYGGVILGPTTPIY